MSSWERHCRCRVAKVPERFSELPISEETQRALLGTPSQLPAKLSVLHFIYSAVIWEDTRSCLESVTKGRSNMELSLSRAPRSTAIACYSCLESRFA